VVLAAGWAWSRLAHVPAGAVRTGALISAIVLVAYLLWKEWYFGYAPPNAFYIKATRAGFNGIIETKAFLSEYAWTFSILGAALVVAAVVAVRRRDMASSPPELSIAALLAVAWIVYSSKIVHEMGFNHRFIIPLVIPIAGCLVIAAGRIPETPVLARTGIAASVVALLATAWHVRGVVSDFLIELRSPPTENVWLTGLRRAGESIQAAGLGWRPMLQCPAAGVLPYYAQCRHFDQGLVTDLLNPRMPPIVRKCYRETLHPDIVVENLLPASAGVQRLDDDPAFQSAYVQEWWLGDPPDMDASMRATWGKQGVEARKKELFERMIALRDRATLVGEVRMPERRWRVFFYVSNDSPFRVELVEALGHGVDITAADVRADDWPPR
jgi:hypothetical protein